jgi:hypothetical protein
MKHFLLLSALLFFLTIRAQNIRPSNTYVRTCIGETECASINSSSFLFYDETKNKFYLKLDFNIMKTGVDSVDFWLEDLNDTYLYYKASLPRDQFPGLSSYNTVNITMQGQMFLNNIWRDVPVPITIYRAEHDMLNNNTNANELEAFEVNFSFSFLPKDFAVNKKPQRLTNTIFIGVGGGQINLLKPGQEGLVGEAYSH